MTLIKNLRHHAQVNTPNTPFAGTYTWPGWEASYWLDGTRDTGIIHFTVPGEPNDEFLKFHISTSVGPGANGAVRYRRETNGWVYNTDPAKIEKFTNILELRDEYRPLFRTWLEQSAHNVGYLQWCAAAAAQFVAAVS